MLPTRPLLGPTLPLERIEWEGFDDIPMSQDEKVLLWHAAAERELVNTLGVRHTPQLAQFLGIGAAHGTRTVDVRTKWAGSPDEDHPSTARITWIAKRASSMQFAIEAILAQYSGPPPPDCDAVAYAERLAAKATTVKHDLVKKGLLDTVPLIGRGPPCCGGVGGRAWWGRSILRLRDELRMHVLCMDLQAFCDAAKAHLETATERRRKKVARTTKNGSSH